MPRFRPLLLVAAILLLAAPVAVWGFVTAQDAAAPQTSATPQTSAAPQTSTAPQPAAATPPPAAVRSPAAKSDPTVLVINSNDATLSVLDLSHRTELRRLPVLREPHHWALTPDGHDLLIGDSGANELIVLDPATFDIRRRVPVSDPYQLGFTPDGNLLVVAALARAQVDVYEPGSYRLLKRFALKSMPSHLAYTPDSGTVFVTLQGTGKLAAIDLRRMEVLWTTDVGIAPAGVLWLNGRVLVANMGSDDLAVVNPADGRVEQRIRTGRGAHQLFPSPDGKLLYVNNRLDTNSVTVLDAATLAVVRSYKLPGGPDDLVFAPDGRIWLTLRFINKVAVLDPVTGQYETISVGRSPHGIYLHADAARPTSSLPPASLPQSLAAPVAAR